jgi:hypothetical protein
MRIAAKGDFVGVARTICADAPEWLPVALAHYAVWIDGSDSKEIQPEIKKRIQQMQEAVRVLKNSLPIWENAGFNVACPPSVKMVLDGLPGLQSELDKLSSRSIGRRPDRGGPGCLNRFSASISGASASLGCQAE